MCLEKASVIVYPNEGTSQQVRIVCANAFYFYIAHIIVNIRAVSREHHYIFTTNDLKYIIQVDSAHLCLFTHGTCRSLLLSSSYLENPNE